MQKHGHARNDTLVVLAGITAMTIISIVYLAL